MPVAITQPTSLPAATLRALKAASITKVIVLGGETIVAPAVLTALAAEGITLDQRIFGGDRAETSTKLADYMITSQGFSNTAVNVASGASNLYGADALGGSALSGKENRPTLITGSGTVAGRGLLEFLTAHSATLASGHIFGGTGAVSAALATAMTNAARAVVSNQTYTVSPSTAASIALDATTTFRQYTVATGAATQVDIQLYPAASVTTTGNTVTFADTNSDNIADPGSPVGAITVVNGVGSSGTRANNVTPVNGAVTFTIDNTTTAGAVVPVVYADANASNSLDLVVPTTANALPKQPSEAFGIGGATTWTPAQAANAANFAVASLVSVDKTGNSFVGDPSTISGTDTFTYFYDSNDTYKIGGFPATMTSFEAALSTGDAILTGSVYTRDVAASSVFDLGNNSPSAPLTMTFSATTTTTTTVGWTVPASGAPDTYNVYRVATTAPTTLGDVTLYTKVGTVAGDATTLEFVNTGLAANTTYYYAVTAVQDAEESDALTGNHATSAVSAGAVAGAPVITDVRAVDAGTAFVFGAGDEVQFIFNEPVTIPAGSAFRVSDGVNSGTLTIGGSASTIAAQSAGTYDGVTVLAGQAYRVRLLTDLTALSPASSLVGFPATITQVTAGLVDIDEALTLSLATGDRAINAVTDFTPAIVTTVPVITAGTSVISTRTATFISSVAIAQSTVDTTDFVVTGTTGAVLSATVSTNGLLITVVLTSGSTTPTSSTVVTSSNTLFTTRDGVAGSSTTASATFA